MNTLQKILGFVLIVLSTPTVIGFALGYATQNSTYFIFGFLEVLIIEGIVILSSILVLLGLYLIRK